MKVFVQCILMIAFVFLTVSGIKTETLNSKSYYEALDKAHNNWIQQKDNSLYKQLLNEFPQKQYETSIYLGFSYYILEEYENLFELFEWAFEKGFVYDSYHLGEMEKIRESEKFKKIIETNKKLKKEAKKNSKPFLDVITPEEYSDHNKYPLFIVLNKGIRDRETLINNYRSGKIKSEFILAFMRSSQFRSTDAYGWNNKDLSRKEIFQMFNEILKNYNIDTTSVIIGGMSSAGGMALDIVMNNTIPVKGFILFCPSKPGSLTLENVTVAKSRNTRGFMFGGEFDKHGLPLSQEIDKIFREADFPCIFKINKHDHVIPDDSYEHIDESINFIFKTQ